MFWLIALLRIALAVTGGIALSKYIFRLLVAAAVIPPVGPSGRRDGHAFARDGW